MNLRVLASMAGLALLTTTASAQKVTWDYDKGTDFSRLKTYTWVRGTPVRDELNHKRIVAAVDAQMAARGFTLVEPGAGPDVQLAYHANFERDLQINASSSDWGNYRWGSNRVGSARVEEITKGTLMVEMVDAKHGGVIWRGVASRDLDMNADPEKRDRNINRTAEKLFKRYPPAK